MKGLTSQFTLQEIKMTMINIISPLKNSYPLQPNVYVTTYIHLERNTDPGSYLNRNIYSPFAISHNRTCLPLKLCITFVFDFSWVKQWFQEKYMTMLVQNFGGQTMCIMREVKMANKCK